jgi:hypothetical protein
MFVLWKVFKLLRKAAMAWQEAFLMRSVSIIEQLIFSKVHIHK